MHQGSQTALSQRRGETVARRWLPGELNNLAEVEPGVVSSLKEAMAKTVPAWAPEVPYNPTPEALERLRSLGYIR